MAALNLNHPPELQQLPKHGVLTLWGFGIKVRLVNSHFLAEWGVGLDRYQVRLSRVEGHKLRRVILLGSDGYISFESLRFITDVGGSFSMLDKRGKGIMVCSPVSPSDARLRRAQSLALGNGTALRISKELIAQKLDGQAALVRDLLHNNNAAADAILRFKADLPTAQHIESVRIIEAQAAKVMWSAWADVPVFWAKRDSRRIPEHWKHFGQRISQLTHSPRLATNPPNAILNLLYCLLENESRIALVAMGLLPDVGLLHVDAPNRDSLVFDVMEVCRVKCDAFLLHWLQTEPFRKSDWFEARDGSCRMVTSLAIKLCETADTWRRFVAPVAEYVAQELWNSISRAPSSRAIATRLTQSTKRAVKGSEVPGVEMPKQAHGCCDCGAPLRRRNSERCAKCSKRITRVNFKAGRGLAQNPQYRAKMANTMRAHKRAIANWNPADLPSWLTRDAYKERVLPALASVSPTQICRALNVSWPYTKAIQNGRIPNTRHWEKLARLVGVVPST